MSKESAEAPLQMRDRRHKIGAMYTAYALVRNLERAPGRPSSARAELLFEDFRIWNVTRFEGPNGERSLNPYELFQDARLDSDDWVYERNYASLPPASGPAPKGVGGIPEDTEDALLLLRLFKTGDISFVRLRIRDQEGNLHSQYPHRVMSEVPARQLYHLSQDECPKWDTFANELRGSLAWKSCWFGVARRYFLYGGAKEFNCYLERQSGVENNEVDRVVDYMIALEAALVPERDFVSRRLRERAAHLICADPVESEATKKLLRELYDVRSTIAHGSPLSDEQRCFLERERENFENVVRKSLVESLRKFPAADVTRKDTLSRLWDISDGDRAQKLFEDFGKIKDLREKSILLQRLSKRSG